MPMPTQAPWCQHFPDDGPVELMTGAPTYDQWGILNWARDANRALWEVAPSARIHLLRDAAVRRWAAHYQQRSSVFDFLDYAQWLHQNLDTITDGVQGWH